MLALRITGSAAAPFDDARPRARLECDVEEALGPGSQIADIRVGWSRVTVGGLHIKGPQGWAATDALGRIGPQAAGDAAKGIGGGIQGLFNGPRKK